MGMFDWLFGSKEKGGGFKEIPLSGSQKFADKWLWDLLKQIETFKPREIAQMTTAEKGAVGIAERAVSEGIPGVSEAMQVLTERMTGDVEQVPGLEGLFAKVKEMGADLLGRTKRGLSLTGNLPTESSRGEKIYGRTLQDILNEMVTAAFPFYSQGLAAKYAAPEQLAKLGMGDVTTRAALGTTTGALPRTIEQSVLDAIFEAQRMTQTFPYTYQTPVAENIMGQERYYYQQPTTSPSIFSQIAEPAATLGAAAIMASDVHLKENFERIDNALNKVKQLEGHTYNFKGQDERTGGIIAQDLEKVMPEAVIEIKGIKHIRLDAVIGLLVNAVKELAEKVA